MRLLGSGALPAGVPDCYNERRVAAIRPHHTGGDPVSAQEQLRLTQLSSKAG